MNKEQILETLKAWITIYGFKAVVAILMLLGGFWLARGLKSIVGKVATQRRLDPTIGLFLSNMTYFAVLTFVVVAVLGQLGVQTASFVAVLGAIGLAVGLALQGSLSNFAAGFLLILFRPFKKGDVINSAGTEGIVEEIQVFCTIIHTLDGRQIIVPNSKLTADNIVNYTTRGTRRIDLAFGVDHTQDLARVRSALQSVAQSQPRVLKDPAPVVVVKELADSKMILELRAWVAADDYNDAYVDLLEKAKLRFVADGIAGPIPRQMVLQERT